MMCLWTDLKENMQTVVELEKLSSGIPARGSTVLNDRMGRVVMANPTLIRLQVHARNRHFVEPSETQSSRGGREGFPAQGGRA